MPQGHAYPGNLSFRFRFFYSTKPKKGMSEIKNAGGKGYCLMYFFIFLLLFIILVVSIYMMNSNGLPG